MAQTVKNLPAKQETRVQSLGWEDLLEEGMATHSNILAWRIPWTEEPGELSLVQTFAQSWPTLCDPMDYTVHGILQARILEQVAFPFSMASFQSRD